MKNIIHLYSGGHFNINDPDSSIYNIEDVATNLSHINRFTGSSEKPYPVSQHAVYVSLLLEQWGHSHLALAGLMHDNSEAFLGDVSQPLKRLLPDYRKIEHKVEASIFKKYGLEFPMNSVIKDADNSVFVAERRDLQPNCPQGLVYNGVEVQAAPFVIVPWSAEKSKKMFLERYYELGGEYK